MSFGPQLPPGFTLPKPDRDSGDEPAVDPFTPALPPGLAGAPPHRAEPDNDTNTADDAVDPFTPQLPPHLRQPRRTAAAMAPMRRSVIGPSMPLPLGNRDQTSGNSARHQRNNADDDDDLYGPLPPPQGYEITEEEELELKKQEIEERMQQAKSAADSQSAPLAPQRGEWMLVPPEAQRLDLGPQMKSRQFSKVTKDADEDRSVWTDTPADREKRRLDLAEKKRKRQPSPRAQTDEEIRTAELVHRYNESQRGSKSLLQGHQEDYMKQRRFEEDDVSKRGFDRERDMKSHRIDPKKRQEIIDKSKDLGDRFSHGKKSYL
ncbi:uncharacterized protein BJ171DRAFT_91926 [Polychytrium aggregatum]|uniref:uncharacterized protein n=1 Tax=Polychytrium aggregatum TaxID=110093 RepID=UPI0022FED466|nr:uncharacterized protein BJ171DRAFT_91926 [Polychytrium aggregatum]KAI9204929.1 hypothetical protein BJ171DRAFT_91926 [Polychytrium aggregatum]